MPIPAFRDDGWLPEGHHYATWDELEDLLGGPEGSPRRRVLNRLLDWRDQTRIAGMSGLLIVHGSFASSKEVPGDSDCVFVYDDSVLRIVADPKARKLTDYRWCKENGYGDIFVFPKSVVEKFPHLCGLDMFDYDKRTKERKGVVEVEI